MKTLKKCVKKIQTLFMVMLTLSMTLPVNIFALNSGDESTVSDMTKKVKVNGVETDNDSVTVNAYRIIDVNVDNDKQQPKAPVYTWDVAVGQWIANSAKYSKYIQKDKNGNIVKTEDAAGTHYAVSDEFTPCKNEEDTKCLKNPKEFYDELANAIKGEGGITLNPVATVAAPDGDISLTLTMGNYLLLIEGGMNVYEPSAINIVPEFNETTGKWELKGTDEQFVKSSQPDIVKKVNSNDVAQNRIGETVNFTLDVDVPTYPSNAIDKRIIISDKFSEGLSLNKTSIKVKFGEGENDVIDPSNYELLFDGDNYTFQITFNNQNYEDALRGKDKITVEYDGVINGKAIVTTGNANDATLKYINNPYKENDFKTKTDDVEVYTYGLDIKKIDGNTKTPLTGAEFKISTTEGGEALSFVKETDKNGKVYYRLAVLDDIKDANGEVIVPKDTGIIYTDNLVVDENGILDVRGLAQGEYWATETKAPDGGYVLLQKAVKMTIKDNDNAAELNGLVADEDGTNGFVHQDIENFKDMIILPVTGGIGTLLFTAVGILFMGLGAFLIKNILKKENE